MSDDSSLVTVAKEGGITLIGGISENLLRFAFLVIITRLVTQSTYGNFTLAMSVVMFLYQIFDFNMSNTVNYYMPQYLKKDQYGQAASVLLRATTIGTVSTVAGTIVVWIFVPEISALFGEGDLTEALYVLCLMIPLLGLFRILLACFASLKKLKYRVYTQNIIRPSAKLVVTIGLVFLIDELVALLTGFVVALLLATLSGGYFLFRRFPELFSERKQATSYRSLASYAWPLVFSGMVYATVGQIDLFAIGYFTSSSDVAVYKVAFALSSTLMIFIRSLDRVYKPIIAENQNDDHNLQQYYQLMGRWVPMLVVPPSVTLIIAPEFYLSLFFTSQYAAGGVVVSILAVRYLLLAGLGPAAQTLEGVGYTRYTLVNASLILGLNGILNVLLVPQYGIAGAAIGTTVATAIGTTTGVVELSYFRKLSPFRIAHLKLWVSAALTGVTAFLFQFAVSGIVLGVTLPFFVVLVYFLSLRATRSFTDSDREIAARIDEKLDYRIVQLLVS